MSQIVPHKIASARAWHDTFSAPVLTVSRPLGGAYAKRFTGCAPEIEQPALSDHVLCLHLGGAKRVRRSLGAPTRDYSVEDRALTIMPARQSNRWVTTGPIDFAHLVLEPRQLERIALEEFDRAPGTWELPDTVGLRDPLIERLFVDLLTSGARGDSPGPSLSPKPDDGARHPLGRGTRCRNAGPHQKGDPFRWPSGLAA